MKDVICQSTHPEDLDDGRVLGIGEEASVDETNEHNARLIEEGRLTVLGAKPTQTVEEVLADVGDDQDKAEAALVRERAASRPRSTLIERLEALAAGTTTENPEEASA
jgi:hypothetical protein